MNEILLKYTMGVQVSEMWEHSTDFTQVSVVSSLTR